MEAWLLAIGFGAAGFAFLSPIAQSFVTKIFPSAGATTQTILSAVAGAAGVIVGLYIGREVFGSRVKGV